MIFRFATGFVQNFMGLSFKQSFDDVMVFNVRKYNKPGVHTFFMRFPIDVFFVRDGVVIQRELNVKPFRFVLQEESCDFILEAECGQVWLDVGSKARVFDGSIA